MATLVVEMWCKGTPLDVTTGDGLKVGGQVTSFLIAC